MQLPDQPPIWKMNLLIWLALYPSVMLLSLINIHTLGELPLALNMINNAITVAVTGWLLCRWPRPMEDGSKRNPAAGTWQEAAQFCPADGVLYCF